MKNPAFFGKISRYLKLSQIGRNRMKRTPYFYLVLFISKLVRFMLLKLGRNATNFTGELAIWL